MDVTHQNVLKCSCGSFTTHRGFKISMGKSIIRSMIRTLAVLLLVLDWGLAFNIRTSMPRLIERPGISAKGGDVAEGKGSFFGYDFAMNADTSEEAPSVSFVIGSPKDGESTGTSSLPTGRGKTSVPNKGDPTKPGEMYLCGIEFEQNGLTQGKKLHKEGNCRSVGPDKSDEDPEVMTDRDSTGLNIVKEHPENENNDVMTCAPLRQRNCTTDYMTEGACYKSGDFGENWDRGSKQATAQCPIQQVDLVFVLDGSGSVTSSNPENFNTVKTWVKTVTSKFDIKDFAQVGVIQYSHWYQGRDEQPYIKTEIELGKYKDQRTFEMEVDKINIQGYTTYTAHAINKTVLDFIHSSRFNDSDTKKVMILLTDGRSNDVADLPQSAAYARSLGITIFAVGVAEYSETELQIMATGETGNNQRVYGLQRFSDLQKIVESLRKSITGILEGGGAGNQTNELQNSETGVGGYIGKVEYKEMCMNQ